MLPVRKHKNHRFISVTSVSSVVPLPHPRSGRSFPPSAVPPFFQENRLKSSSSSRAPRADSVLCSIIEQDTIPADVRQAVSAANHIRFSSAFFDRPEYGKIPAIHNLAAPVPDIRSVSEHCNIAFAGRQGFFGTRTQRSGTQQRGAVRYSGFELFGSRSSRCRLENPRTRVTSTSTGPSGLSTVLPKQH